jgi:hypothetical protein
MLEEVGDSQESRIVSFLPHGRAFMVHDVDAFVKTVLPRYFGTLLSSNWPLLAFAESCRVPTLAHTIIACSCVVPQAFCFRWNVGVPPRYPAWLPQLYMIDTMFARIYVAGEIAAQCPNHQFLNYRYRWYQFAVGMVVRHWCRFCARSHLLLLCSFHI